MSKVTPKKEAGGPAVSKALIGLFTFLAVVIAPSPCFAQAPDLSIGNYELVSQTRVGRTIFEYTYRADLANNGAVDVLSAAGALTSGSPNTVVVDGSLGFGAVAAGATATSNDTFSFRQNRRYPFDWADLAWDIAFEPAPPPTIAVPRVVGLLLADAATAIADAGFSLGVVEEAPRATVPTGIVIAQDPSAGAQELPGTFIDIVMVAPPPLDESIPDSFVGEWELTINYLNGTTGQLESVQKVTDTLCPGDPFGLALVEQIALANPDVSGAACTGSVTAGHMEANCSASGTVALVCSLDVTMAIGLGLDGDNLSGAGEWTALTTGACEEIPLPGSGQSVVFTGIRLDTVPGAACALPASSWFQKFMRHPLIQLLDILP